MKMGRILARAPVYAAAASVVGIAMAACQDYPFEAREDARTEARQLREVIQSVTPVDILFVIDNSGSMVDELFSLQQSLALFVNGISEAKNDFRIGFVTPDLECNLPECSGSPDPPCRECPSQPGGTQNSCCLITGDAATCVENDDDGDGDLDSSTCDGGRLRSDADPSRRWFDRPAEADLNTWLAGVDASINGLGCEGSGFEGGLEAARRALVCSLTEAQREDRGLRIIDPNDGVTVLEDACPDQRVADLNQGFVRDGAELVVVYVTDEDDCSFQDGVAYSSVASLFDPNEHATKLCSPNECYAYHNAKDATTGGDHDGDTIIDWADPQFTAQPYFRCSGINRLRNPPMPDPVSDFIDDIVAVKKTAIDDTVAATRVRFGGIFGGMVGQGSGSTGFASAGCFFDPFRTNGLQPDPGPSDQCGCWSNSPGATNVFCEVTRLHGQSQTRQGIGNDGTACGTGSSSSQVGCGAVPAGRYLDAIEELATRRQGLGAEAGVVVDTICQDTFAQTMEDLVGIVTPATCYDIGIPGIDPNEIEIRLNDSPLDKVTPPTVLRGWTHSASIPTEVCLVNLGSLNVGDRFEVFVLTDP